MIAMTTSNSISVNAFLPFGGRQRLDMVQPSHNPPPPGITNSVYARARRGALQRY